MSRDDVLRRKLSPSNFDAMSPKMSAIVGYITGAHYTEPEIDEMTVTSDGYVLAQLAGDMGFNVWIGEEASLSANWDRLLAAADLTDDEMLMAVELYGVKVGHA